MNAAAVAVALTMGASAHAQVLLSEGFDSTATPAGWIFTNASSPVGLSGWFGGDTAILMPQAGAGFLVSNFNAAAVGGTISNWVISPTFSTALPTRVTFYASAEIFSSFSDLFNFGSSSGDSSTASFTMGSTVTATGSWTQYTLDIPAGGAGTVGRFAVQHLGLAASANYLGIDSVTVTAVPEPASWMLLGGGLLAAAGLARRRAASGA